MSLTLLAEEIYTEDKWPIKTPNPFETVDITMNSLTDIEAEIDSDQVDSEVINLETGGIFFKTNKRKALQIKLRNPKEKLLKNFGGLIFPVEFGNLVYIVKYEYINVGFFALKEERIAKIKKKLNTIDKWMEYTFIQTLSDYVYVKLLKKYDPNFKSNVFIYPQFFSEV